MSKLKYNETILVLTKSNKWVRAFVNYTKMSSDVKNNAYVQALFKKHDSDFSANYAYSPYTERFLKKADEDKTWRKFVPLDNLKYPAVAYPNGPNRPALTNINGVNIVMMPLSKKRWKASVVNKDVYFIADRPRLAAVGVYAAYVMIQRFR